MNPLARGLSLLVIAAFSVFSLVAYTSMQNWAASAEREVDAEITTLRATSDLISAIGALDPVVRRANAGQGHYLIVDMDGQRVAGNVLSFAGRPAPDDTEFRRWRVMTESGPKTVYGRWIRVEDSFDILVSRSPQNFWNFLLLVGSIFLVATLLAGIIAWRYARRRERRDDERLRAFVSAFEAIARGEQVARPPVDGGRDGLNRLARLFDAQIERIEDYQLTLKFFNRFIQHDVINSLKRGRHELESIQVPDEAVLTALDLISESEERCGGIRHLADYETRGQDAFEPVDLSQIVRAEVEHMEFEAEPRGIRIDSDIGEACTWGIGGALQILVGNLLRNAVTYTRDGGRVHVELGLLPDGRPQLRILDEGPGLAGFPPHFDFARGPMDARRGKAREGSEGLGIGLILAFRIVQILDCEICFDDRPARQGLEIRLVCPMLKEAPLQVQQGKPGQGVGQFNQ